MSGYRLTFPTFQVLVSLWLVVAVQCEPDDMLRTTVSEEAMNKCHRGVRDFTHRCHEYTTENLDKTKYPKLPANCSTIDWKDANETNNWGNCFAMTTDTKYRYISSNNVPNFYMNLYCPIGLGFGYCSHAEIAKGTCMFEGIICGGDNGPGGLPYGDVWVPTDGFYKIPLVGNPTRPDRPFDMYDAYPVGGEKNVGPAAGVAINGISIQGPNDAGDVTIDEAGMQLTCGGHVTPPLGNKALLTPPQNGSLTKPPGPAGPPMYHFHKSPECLEPFLNASIGVEHGAKPYEHGKLIGWALDGFKIFSYQDIGGAAPVVDECGGHFGPIDTGEIEYHYHSRQISPYHLACQGPSLGRCAHTQRGTNFCHPGCGADICVQPGTDETKLRAYLAKWDHKWMDRFTVNDFRLKKEDSKVNILESAITTLLDHLF